MTTMVIKFTGAILLPKAERVRKELRHWPINLHIYSVILCYDRVLAVLVLYKITW